jgi:hypothetical protein
VIFWEKKKEGKKHKTEQIRNNIGNWKK